ncbi:MAG: Rpn family recombination-promoting nuclease/putative transposase [Lachnospiraceae bacterium]|nr:Rpn family recombination-promoting nuclease/putative transposase [Lachnospiraceae bacterium]MDE6184935.1 Rpn family recombination-promoting nuclease/putative transposase [Lachnospiraceae bacterium]
MGKEDIGLKSYLEDAERYADLWNGGVFEGKEMVKAGQLQEINPILHKADDKGFLERNRDLVMKQSSDGKCFAVFAVENQKTVDYGMPVRIMLQEALEYSHQIQAIMKDNENADKALRQSEDGEGDTSTIYRDVGERLYKIRKEDRLYPVMTLVVYWGEKEWKGPRSLHDMIDFTAESRSMEEEFRKLIPEYPLRFLDLSTFEHFEYFKTELRPLLELFRRRNCKEDFLKYIKENQDSWKMNNDSWFMLSQLTQSKRLKSLIREKRQEANAIEKEESEDRSMLKALDDLVNDAKMEGKIEGKLEGKIEGKIEGKAESIIAFLEDYGEVPGSLKDEILNQKDLAMMQRWIKLAVSSGSIQNFIKEMHVQN